MDEFLFVRDGEYVVPTDYSRGAWTPELLDGPPVVAVLAHQLEGVRPEGLELARLTVDLLAPVPMSPLRVSTREVHAGKRFQIVDAEIFADGRLVSRASALHILESGGPPFAMLETAVAPPPAPESARAFPIPSATTNFQSHASESRMYRRASETEPFAFWMRIGLSLFPGVPLSPTVAAAALSERANAATGMAPDLASASINADLTFSLARRPVGEWFAIDGLMRLKGEGRGAGTALVYDTSGVVGFATVSQMPSRFELSAGAEMSSAFRC